MTHPTSFAPHPPSGVLGAKRPEAGPVAYAELTWRSAIVSAYGIDGFPS
jgi:hypothetical protein